MRVSKQRWPTQPRLSPCTTCSLEQGELFFGWRPSSQKKYAAWNKVNFLVEDPPNKKKELAAWNLIESLKILISFLFLIWSSDSEHINFKMIFTDLWVDIRPNLDGESVFLFNWFNWFVHRYHLMWKVLREDPFKQR